MTISDLLTYCMSKSATEQTVKEEWEATQIKRHGVLCAMVHEKEGRPALTLKTSPALAELLREEHSDIFPSEHLHKSCWSTLWLDGSLKDSQIYYLLDAAMQQADATHAAGTSQHSE